MHAVNNRVSGYMKQKVIKLKRRIGKSITIVGEFNTLFLAINKTSRQKIGKDIELHNSINQLYLIDIYRTFHSARAKYIVFTSAQGIFTKLDHILVHKTNFKKGFKLWFKKIHIGMGPRELHSQLIMLCWKQVSTDEVL